ncbi:MAG: hypothetical protein FWH53_03775 [Leptospirales bacterium]|nr:hypothetical protein [Leptospirales bacterium]
MKSKNFLPIFLMFYLISCSTTSFFKDKITIDQVLAAKEIIDASQNPAEVLLLKNDLSEKIVILDNVYVKDIIISTNVDYDFCVLADLQSDKGPIECYIYTKNVKRISQLIKGVSIISVKGEFNRFFSMLDNYYTKIEITNSDVTIVKQ